jgi:putative transposase
MVEQENLNLSVIQQCKLLNINRSSFYYQAKPENADNLLLMKIIDQIFLKYPFYGSRQMRRHLIRNSYQVSRHKVRRLMQLMGLAAIYQKPNISKKHPEHKIYPYLLRNLTIDHSNQVWCSDITYIPLKKGFMYLIAVKDWYSRKVLSWRLSNTMDTAFCLAALDEAIERYGTPKIFNTDQGSQYTSNDFTAKLQQHNIKISMDGKGRWVDNVFIERLWRSLKYECVYLQDFENAYEARKLIGDWINYYNNIRPHSVFDGKTPNEVYNGTRIKIDLLAA